LESPEAVGSTETDGSKTAAPPILDEDLETFTNVPIRKSSTKPESKTILETYVRAPRPVKGSEEYGDNFDGLTTGNATDNFGNAISHIDDSELDDLDSDHPLGQAAASSPKKAPADSWDATHTPDDTVAQVADDTFAKGAEDSWDQTPAEPLDVLTPEPEKTKGPLDIKDEPQAKAAPGALDVAEEEASPKEPEDEPDDFDDEDPFASLGGLSALGIPDEEPDEKVAVTPEKPSEAESPQGAAPLPEEMGVAFGTSGKGADEVVDGEGGADRTRFLESLLDGTDTQLPKKVELDLDGIFDQAKKEAENLTPDSTHLVVEAPAPAATEEHEDFEEPAPPPEPLLAPAQRKVSKLKLLFFIVPVVVGVALLLFGLYHIFFSKGEPPPEPELVLTDPLDMVVEPEPGEVTLAPFKMTLEGEDGARAVAQIDFIIHYHDTPDGELIRTNMVEIRDLIYRITKARGPQLLSDSTVRRKLQADLLSTINDMPPFKTDSDPKVTYVQISVLRKM
jgi:flagellar basal body-associated protein FliL